MNEIDMLSVIALIPDDMFPEAPLPDATLTFRNSCLRAAFYSGDGLNKANLIAFQRLEKSSSLGGKVQIQCK